MLQLRESLLFHCETAGWGWGWGGVRVMLVGRGWGAAQHRWSMLFSMQAALTDCGNSKLFFLMLQRKIVSENLAAGYCCMYTDG